MDFIRQEEKTYWTFFTWRGLVKQRLVKLGEESDEAKNFAVLLYVAALTSGYEIEDSGDFASRILSMMTSKAKGDVQDAVVESTDVVQEHVDVVTTTTITDAQKEFFAINVEENFENV